MGRAFSLWSRTCPHRNCPADITRLVMQDFPDMFRLPAHTYFPFSCKYCYREENASFSAEKGEMIYESYRYRSPGRRPGPHRHSKPPYPEDSGGRPVADNMDTLADFLLFHAGSGEAKPLEWYIMTEVVNFKCNPILIGFPACPVGNSSGLSLEQGIAAHRSLGGSVSDAQRKVLLDSLTQRRGCAPFHSPQRYKCLIADITAAFQ